MVKTRIILVLISAGLVVLIFMLPKVVVKNENTLSGSDSAVSRTAEVHAETPEALKNQIALLRSDYNDATEKEKSAIFADSLATLYRNAGKFDSAAWFAEEAATFFDNTKGWEKAGDQYYQAYTFALDESKQQRAAEKAQEYYSKVLKSEPGNLTVKTNMAMTYLSSSNPMQGITMLREVLAEDPKNEEALFNMGMLSVQSGQYERAVERLKELMTVNSNHVQGNLLLGIALMNTGKKKEAREYFEKVKEMDGDPAVQATVDSYLEDLK